MKFLLSFTPTAETSLKELKKSPNLEKCFKAVSKALRFLQENPRHPSLETHEFYSFKGPNGKKVFEAYRIFFFYGKQRWEIIIIAITPHP